MLLLLFCTLFSFNSFSLNVMIEQNNNASKMKIYNKILESIDPAKIINQSDLKSFTSVDRVYIIGEQLYNRLKGLDINVNFILMGVYLPPSDIHEYDNWKVISLFASEKSLNINFSEYEHIYSTYKDESDWYYSALKDNPKYIFKKINSQKNAIMYYRKISKSINENDLFLLNPYGFFDKTTITELLQLSWEHQFKTFSILPSHSKKGFLFSPYFEKDSISKFLIKYDDKFINQPKITGIETNLYSINSRTAKHIGIKRKYMENFKVIY